MTKEELFVYMIKNGWECRKGDVPGYLEMVKVNFSYLISDNFTIYDLLAALTSKALND